MLFFGYGYTAKRLRRKLEKNWQVRGTARGPERLAEIEADGVTPFLFGRDEPLPSEALEGVTHLVTSIPPDEAGDPVLDVHLDDLQGSRALEWAGYLGTTAVYGDRGGAWVTEDDPVAPTLPRAERRAAAERAWLESGLPAHLFRLAGIYGPGRSPIDNLQRGTARRIIKPGQVFSRIHVDDIATVLLASMAKPRPGAIYNVCDDDPAPPQDVVAHAAGLLGLEPPPEQPYGTADLSPMARTFYQDNRRVSNALIKDELGVRLAYPSYREGLASLL